PPPPPGATLFPYTTLFRSHVRELALDDLARTPASLIERSGVDHAERVDHRRERIAQLVSERREEFVLAAVGRAQRLLGVAALVGDRKSTRLNSSHVKISYA